MTTYSYAIPYDGLCGPAEGKRTEGHHQAGDQKEIAACLRCEVPGDCNDRHPMCTRCAERYAARRRVYLAVLQRPMTLEEIASAAGMAPGNAKRTADNLAMGEYIEKNPISGRYRAIGDDHG